MPLVLGGLFPRGWEIGIWSGALVEVKVGALDQIQERLAGSLEFNIGVVARQKSADFEFGVLEVLNVGRQGKTKKLVDRASIEPVTDEICFCKHGEGSKQSGRQCERQSDHDDFMKK